MQGGGRRRGRVGKPRGQSKFLEKAYLADIKDAGLPSPRTQYRFHEVRQWKVDAFWTLPRGYLAVEIEGGTGKSKPKISHHLTVDGYRNDCEKYNALAEWGIRTGKPVVLLRFTGAMVGDKTARDDTKRVFLRLGGELKGKGEGCRKSRGLKV